MKHIYLILTSTVLLFVALGTVVPAHPASAERRDYRTQLREELEKEENKYRARMDEMRDQQREIRDHIREGRQDQSANRLSENRLQKCQEHSDKINQLMQQASERSTQKLATLDQVAKRVQEFYRNRDYNVAQYDDLVASVNQKREDAVTALSQMNVDGEQFRCNGDNPDATLAAYRDAHKAKSAAIKEYKTAVRELILAIKSSVSEKQGASRHDNS